MRKANYTLLQAEELAKAYGHGRSKVAALLAFTGEVDSNGRVGVIGESGSGKSTLSRLLVGLERPSSGAVFWNGRNLASLTPREWRGFRKEVQYIAQDTSSSFDPRRSLLDSLLQPMRWLTDLDHGAALQRAEAVLTMLGLDIAAARGRPYDVSGGQRQRFAIARALVVQPSLLICDEVVSALDVSVQGSILNLLVDYCASNDAGLLFVSHGIPATAFISDELMVMHRGAVLERGPVAEVLRAPADPYTAGLLKAAS
ncbi:ABC transporter ATP-binding protein [Phytohabitans rumicis]|uniref:ABC transporter ATP-binding protein n=1 Tax=Phytohabitans rumicis TaxID=1076125 RepID=A0A6V8LH76_9ACTN|nr:ATP-binding cassette domain-containing protein [Phytohabitans rumicis]GFJ95594.1 ABC transporter ATP-binding protein [Phytohabitans rumicis]